MSDQNATAQATEADIYKKLQALPREDKQHILEIVQILADDRNDVYFVVCENDVIIYQGYAIRTALKTYRIATDAYLKELESGKPTTSNAFGLVYPDNKTSVFDTFTGGE